jgi:Ca2+-binding RTX toxin-like protein
VFTAVNSDSNSSQSLEPIKHKITAADKSNGFVEVAFMKPPEGFTQTVTAYYEDYAGNIATGTAPSDFATLDTLAPGQDVPDDQSLSISVVDSDAKINPKEFEDEFGVWLEIKLPSNSALKDVLDLSVGLRVSEGQPPVFFDLNYEIKQQDLSSGDLKILLPMEEFYKEVANRTDTTLPYEAWNGKYEVEASLTDLAGNKSDLVKTSFDLMTDRIRTTGTQGDDTIEEKNFNRIIDGGDGNDRIEASSGNDWIFGGKGDDVIIAGSGRNVLTGGPGSDTFKYNINSLGAIDTITDFTFGTGTEKDVLMLKDLLSGFTKENAADYFNFSVIGGANETKTGVLKIDFDGSGSNNQLIEINFLNQDQSFKWDLDRMIADGNIVVD